MNGRISFRSSYETASHVRYLETAGNALSVAEAKVAIAKALGLERDFARRFDLKLLNTAEDNKPLDDDSELILPGASLVVQRTLWRPVDVVKHEAQSCVQEWVHGQETVREATEQGAGSQRPQQPLPKRFLCASCGSILQNPRTVRCETGCTASVCEACAADLLTRSSPAVCPQCHKPCVKSFIPNRTLATIIAKLDLSSFNLQSLTGHLGKIDSAKKENSGTSTGVATNHSLTSEGTEVTLSQNPVEVSGYLFFVRPEQIQIVHAHDVLILPSGVDDFELDVTAEHTTHIAAYVFALGGGGTSLITPGTATIREIVFVGGSKHTGTSLATRQLTKKKSTASLQVSGVEDLMELKQISQNFGLTSKVWFDNLVAEGMPPTSFTICKLEWTVKFPSLLLLPGKAQPIAGIRSGNTNKLKYGPVTEIIKLSPPQKQGVAGRLAQEAIFARMNRPGAAMPPSDAPPVNVGTVTQESSAVVPVNTAVNSSVAPTAVYGDYVFDASANAWMTMDRLNRKRHRQAGNGDNSSDNGKNEQWQIASQLRGCFNSTSLLSNLHSADHSSHWSTVNPLLPYMSQLPKLNERSFKLIQALQLVALRRLVEDHNANGALLTGLNEINEEFVASREAIALAPFKNTDSTNFIQQSLPGPSMLPLKEVSLQQVQGPRVRPLELQLPHVVEINHPPSRPQQFPPPSMVSHVPFQPRHNLWAAPVRSYANIQRSPPQVMPSAPLNTAPPHPFIMPMQQQAPYMLVVNRHQSVTTQSRFVFPHRMPESMGYGIPALTTQTHSNLPSGPYMASRGRPPHYHVGISYRDVDCEQSVMSRYPDPTEFYSGKESLRPARDYTSSQRRHSDYEITPERHSASDNSHRGLLDEGRTSRVRHANFVDSGSNRIVSREKEVETSLSSLPRSKSLTTDRKQELLSKSLSSYQVSVRRNSKTDSTGYRHRTPDAKTSDPPAKRRRHGADDILPVSPLPSHMSPRRRRQPSLDLASRRPVRETNAREAAARIFSASLPSQSQRQNRHASHNDIATASAVATTRRRVLTRQSSTMYRKPSPPLMRETSSKSEQSSAITSGRKRPKNSLFT